MLWACVHLTQTKTHKLVPAYVQLFEIDVQKPMWLSPLWHQMLLASRCPWLYVHVCYVYHGAQGRWNQNKNVFIDVVGKTPIYLANRITKFTWWFNWCSINQRTLSLLLVYIVLESALFVGNAGHAGCGSRWSPKKKSSEKGGMAATGFVPSLLVSSAS